MPYLFFNQNGTVQVDRVSDEEYKFNITFKTGKKDEFKYATNNNNKLESVDRQEAVNQFKELLKEIK